jgi:methylamine---glutamate N-methyltransferase subunit A
MCGIAGRISTRIGPVGHDIVELAACMRHRGPDSTGFAIYGVPLESGLVVRAYLDDRQHLDSALDALRLVTKEAGSDFAADPTWDDTTQQHVLLRAQINDVDDLATWTLAAEEQAGLQILSAGRSLEIVKDLGDAREVDAKHHVSSMVGTHALSHMRLATESLVSPIASHPFWARPFPDVCIAHNGQLTNYYKWRRRLEHDGYHFSSENDSELIAVWNSVQMAGGHSLEESLRASISELDGVFTYLLGTADSIGMAKDRWAMKPLIGVRADDGIALATEEQALRSLYREEIAMINYDGPSLTEVWTAAQPSARVA